MANNIDSIISVSTCISSYGNTGTKVCLKDKISYIVGGIFAFRGQAFPSTLADADAFIAALLASQTAEPTSRTWLAPYPRTIKDETKEVTITEFDSGATGGITQHPLHLTFDCDDEGLNKWKEFQEFNGADIVFYPIAVAGGGNKLFVRQLSTGEITGFNAKLIVLDPKFGSFNTPDTTLVYKVQFDKAEDMSKNVDFIDLNDFDLYSNLKGVNDIRLSIGTAPAAKAVGIKALYKRGNGTVNFGDQFHATLAAVDKWVVTDKATGLTVVPATVAWNATAKEFTLTFATAGTYLVELVSAATLLAASVGDTASGGYETKDAITVVIPA